MGPASVLLAPDTILLARASILMAHEPSLVAQASTPVAQEPIVMLQGSNLSARESAWHEVDFYSTRIDYWGDNMYVTGQPYLFKRFLIQIRQTRHPLRFVVRLVMDSSQTSSSFELVDDS